MTAGTAASTYATIKCTPEVSVTVGSNRMELQRFCNDQCMCAQRQMCMYNLTARFSKSQNVRVTPEKRNGRVIIFFFLSEPEILRSTLHINQCLFKSSCYKAKQEYLELLDDEYTCWPRHTAHIIFVTSLHAFHLRV